MSGMFSPSKLGAASPHSIGGTSTLSSSSSSSGLTSKRRIERRTSKIRDLEEHLRKGGVAFPFGAARAIVDNGYESMDDILRLNDDQLVQLLVMAGVKHKSMITFTHYCSGLRNSKSMETVGVDDSTLRNTSNIYRETAQFETPGKGNQSPSRIHSPKSSVRMGAGGVSHFNQTLHGMSGEMSQRGDKPGGSFYDMEKKYGGHVTAANGITDELPFDGFSEVTNSLNVLMLQAKKSYDEAEDEYRSALRTNESFEWAHNNLGLLLMNVRNDYDGAEREFRRAIELDDTYAWPRNNLGLLLFEVREEFAAAEIEFRACIDLEPSNCEAHSNLATLLNAKAMRIELKKDPSTAAAIYMEAADHWEFRHGKHNNYSREARSKAAHLMGMGK